MIPTPEIIRQSNIPACTPFRSTVQKMGYEYAYGYQMRRSTSGRFNYTQTIPHNSTIGQLSVSLICPKNPAFFVALFTIVPQRRLCYHQNIGKYGANPCQAKAAGNQQHLPITVCPIGFLPGTPQNASQRQHAEDTQTAVSIILAWGGSICRTKRNMTEF